MAQIQRQSIVTAISSSIMSCVGSFIYTAQLFTQLSLLDRLSAVTLIQSLLEHDLDEETYTKYDRMTAKQLFSSVSPALYRCGVLHSIILPKKKLDVTVHELHVHIEFAGTSF